MKNASRMTGLMAVCVLLGSATGVGAQDWPQWRGPNRDDKVSGFTAPKTWPKELTKKWRVNVGIGDSSPVLVGDKVYVFARQGGDEVTLCLNASDGTEVWRDKYAAKAVTGPAAGFGQVKHTGPRSTPAVAEGKICTLGVAGVLSCLDAATGQVVWRKDTKAWPKFYTSASPLIVDGKCIADLGGGSQGKVVAYDLATGEPKWQWTGAGPPYGSPVLTSVAGTKQIVTPTVNSLVGISLADGKLLWEVSFRPKYNNSTPIIDGQTVIISGPGAGSLALKIEKKDDGFTATPVWKKGQAPSQYNTPVLRQGLLFGISSGRTFYCMDAKTGAILWSDATRRGECGSVLDTGSVLVALTSDNKLVAFEPSDKAYKELASYTVSDNYTWSCPIIAGNRVFVKDRDSLTLWLLE